MNPLTLVTFVSLTLCLGGMASLLSLALGLSLFILLLVVFLHTKVCAQNLYVKRKLLQSKCFEGDSVQVELIVQNASLGRSCSFRVVDHFKASQEEKVDFSFPEGLSAKSQIKKNYKKTCDGGCGQKEVGPVRILVSDWFGFFHFEVTDSLVDRLEVLPKIEALPEMKLKGSLHSNGYGSYEVSQRGHSVKFRGIREFVPGDSLKHIAWKISAKNNTFLVKEFDRMVNSQVYVAINDAPHLHMGSKNLSTWETTRDVALALVSQQRELGNSIHFISNHWFYDLGESLNSFEILARHLADRSIEEEPFENFTPSVAESYLKKLYKQVPSNSSLFYITPFVDSMEEALVRTVTSMQLNQVNVILVFIDIESYVKAYSKKLDFNKSLFFPPAIHLFRTVHRLQAQEVEVVILQANDPLSDCFLHLKSEEVA